MNINDRTMRTAPGGDQIRDRVAVLTNSSFYNRGRDVLICMLDHEQRIVAVAKTIEMEAKPAEDFAMKLIPPTIHGLAGVEFLQSALEAAWESGLRPKNWRLETTEEVAAMNSHLQDMRRLVFARKVEELKLTEPFLPPIS